MAFRVLCAGSEPNLRTIAAFRKRHLRALSDLFTQVLLLCRKAGLAKLTNVAINGTNVRASASKHKAMRITEEARLKAEIEWLLARSGATDAAEDEWYGPGRTGDERRHELVRRESGLKKIQQAKAPFEEQAWRLAEAAGDTEPERAHPEANAQRPFTDPDCRIILDGHKAFVQICNARFAV